MLPSHPDACLVRAHRSTPTSPHLTFAKARARQRSGSCRVSPSSPRLTAGRSAPRSPCPTPDLPASRSGRRGSPRRAGESGRRAPAPRSPPAATSGRKQQRACAPPPALEPRHVLPCSMRGAALRWRAAAPRGACADLQPRSMRTAAAAATTTARGSVPRKVLPLPGRRENAPRRPPGPRSTCAAAFRGSPPASAFGRQRRCRLLRRCRRRFKIGTRSGHRHRLPPSHAPGRYANEARVPSPLSAGPAPSAGTGAGSEGCLGAGQSPGRPSWRHANEPRRYLNERVAPPLGGRLSAVTRRGPRAPRRRRCQGALSRGLAAGTRGSPPAVHPRTPRLAPSPSASPYSCRGLRGPGGSPTFLEASPRSVGLP